MNEKLFDYSEARHRLNMVSVAGCIFVSLTVLRHAILFWMAYLPVFVSIIYTLFSHVFPAIARSIFMRLRAAVAWLIRIPYVTVLKLFSVLVWLIQILLSQLVYAVRYSVECLPLLPGFIKRQIETIFGYLSYWVRSVYVLLNELNVPLHLLQEYGSPELFLDALQARQDALPRRHIQQEEEKAEEWRNKIRKRERNAHLIRR